MAVVSTTRAIGRLIPNVGRPSEAKRCLLASVVANKLLYAAPIWLSQALMFIINYATLIKAQKVVAIRISRCYGIDGSGRATGRNSNG